MSLKKIIKEEMDWVGDVESSLPKSDFLDKPVPVTLTIRDYLISKYSYNFIDIILESGNVIELTLEGDWDIKYATYDSLFELVEDQGIVNPWGELDDEEKVFNGEILSEYLDEFRMDGVDTQTDEVIRKGLPLLDIDGIYVGEL